MLVVPHKRLSLSNSQNVCCCKCLLGPGQSDRFDHLDTMLCVFIGEIIAVPIADALLRVLCVRRKAALSIDRRILLVALGKTNTR